MYNWMQKQFDKHRAKREKGEAGFTLIELVVVIAIMGILGGAGTVGYTGYLKSAAKKADQALVSNIVRAIEIGTNSTMFTPPESLSLSVTTYPVGIISLSPEGGQTITSARKSNSINSACEIVTENITVLEEHTQAWDCTGTLGTKHTKEYYSVIAQNQQYTYCKTHSIVTTLNSDTPYVTGVTGKNCKSGWFGTCGGAQSDPTGNINLTAGTKVAFAIYELNGTGKCKYAANQGFTYDKDENEKNIYTATGTGVLHESLAAAFGENYPDQFTLQYDGWGNTTDETVDYATFYSYLPTMLEEVESMAGSLATATKTPKLSDYFKGQYDSSEDVYKYLSNSLATKYGNNEQAWIDVWTTGGNYQYDQWGFGVDEYGREAYSAIRKAYNAGFASYLQAAGIESQYVEVVDNFTKPISISGVSLNAFGDIFPTVVNTTSFNDDNSGLKQRFIDAGDTNAGEEGSAFNKCADLFEEYKDSDACKANATSFLDFMISMDDTFSIANDNSNLYGGDAYKYYVNYAEEMSQLYSAAETAADDGIVIIVTVENGEVNCKVSPASADVRNENN
ncbi:MAG: prepilin-type N-terminal cleavage/methylation domain-containing protein [Firmicutes bacterium]|nr:prepilin-type N-terminal cleavage/methylation domain-containing protein [Bacillota bacterium]